MLKWEYFGNVSKKKFAFFKMLWIGISVVRFYSVLHPKASKSKKIIQYLDNLKS